MMNIENLFICTENSPTALNVLESVYQIVGIVVGFATIIVPLTYAFYYWFSIGFYNSYGIPRGEIKYNRNDILRLFTPFLPGLITVTLIGWLFPEWEERLQIKNLDPFYIYWILLILGTAVILISYLIFDKYGILDTKLPYKTIICFSINNIGFFVTLFSLILLVPFDGDIPEIRRALLEILRMIPWILELILILILLIVVVLGLMLISIRKGKAIFTLVIAIVTATVAFRFLNWIIPMIKNGSIKNDRDCFFWIFWFVVLSTVMFVVFLYARKFGEEFADYKTVYTYFKDPKFNVLKLVVIDHEDYYITQELIKEKNASPTDADLIKNKMFKIYGEFYKINSRFYYFEEKKDKSLHPCERIFPSLEKENKG